MILLEDRRADGAVVLESGLVGEHVKLHCCCSPSVSNVLVLVLHFRLYLVWDPDPSLYKRMRARGRKGLECDSYLA